MKRLSVLSFGLALGMVPFAGSAADNYGFTPVTGGSTFIRAKELSTGIFAPMMVPIDAAGVPLFTLSAPGYFTLTGVLPLPSGAATGAKQDTGNTSLGSIDGKIPVQVGGGLPVTPTVGGYAGVAVASFTRPANTTAYAAGQLVANSTTAGSVVPMQFTVARSAAGTGLIRRARLTKSSTATLYATFDLMLYKPTGAAACPVSAAGDGAAYSTDSALLYVGRIPVSMDQAFTDGAKGIGVPATGSEIVFDTLAGSQILCGFVRATGGYTPVSGETFTAALEVLPN